MIRFTSRSSHDAKPVAHDHYVELCALSTSGTLRDAEWDELKEHLAHCADCRGLLQEYREIARTGMSKLLSKDTFEECPAPESWSIESAKQELFRRLGRGEDAGWTGHRSIPFRGIEREDFWTRIRAWKWQTAIGYASAILFASALIGSAYRFAIDRGQQLARAELHSSTADAGRLQTQVSLLREKALLDQELNTRNAQIAQLSRQIKDQTTELRKWKAQQQDTEEILKHEAANLSEARAASGSLASQRDAIARKLEETQSLLASTQNTLDHLRADRTNQLLHMASLETRIKELSNRLNNELKSDQVLASDRDIRELMGARDLYIADVFDVDTNGRTKRPFGRVFYTKEKSLIFYAFDLDQQHGVESAAAFQVWGRRGPSDHRPINMGILYLDNSTNRRWALKFDDPEVLARIDEVFVTVEPKGGSLEPRGKELLFASLRLQPNHP